MARHSKSRIFVFCLLLIAAASRVDAVEMIQFVDSKDYARVMGGATGLKMADDGTVYVSSAEKGTLLSIVDGEVEARSLTPKVFKDKDLGGIDVLPNGQLVVVNADSGQVAIFNSELKLIERFAQSGGDAGELRSPGPVAASINQKIYIGDVSNKRVSVFNQQGLFLYTIGRGGASGDLKKPRHVSIDAEENVYVLEGEERISIFNVVGELLARFTTKELKQYFGKTPKFSALTADLDGNLYIGDRVQRRVTIFDWRNLKVLKHIGSAGLVRGQYRSISYLSINARGQLAVLDKKSKKLEVYQLEQKSFAAPVARDLIKHGLTIDSVCAAQYVFIDEQTLCIKPKNKGIAILAADGSEQGRFGEAAKKPAAIHVGAKTVAIVGDNTLHAYKHDGSHVFSVGRYGSLAGGFNKPSDVFVQGGKYYVVDLGNNRVQVFAADGLFLEEIKGGKGGDRHFTKVGPIAVDSKENLYIADGSSLGQIHVLDKERNKIATIGGTKDTSLKVNRFYDLDLDQQDRLYVLAGSDSNDYGVRVYHDFKPYKAFGAAGKNGTQVYFEKATSLSVLSGSSNSVYVNDVERKKTFRFDLLEYPDAAFGLNIAANHKSINLTWSSSKSLLIEEYEIQAANAQTGPYKPISSSKELNQTLSLESAGAYTWFRVVSVSGHGLQAPPSAPRENHFQNLRAMYQIEKYDEAVKLADRLLKIAPDNADARDLLAMSLFYQQDYTRAISEFRQLAEIKAYRVKAIQHQVLSLYELGQFIDARALIDEVLEKEPVEVEPYLICTRLSLELADAIGAVSCAEDGLEKHEDNVELRYLLGRAYIEAGVVDDGLLEFQTIIENNPENYEIRLKIAEDVYRLGDYAQALEHFDAVISANQGGGVANLGKARALLSLDRDAEAKAIAVKLSGNKETKGAGYYLLGKIAAKSGDHKQAVLRLTRAGKDSPQVVDAWVSLANSYREINQPAKAVKALARGIKSNPEAYELYQLAGQLELGRDRYPEASEYLDSAVQLNPQSLESRRLYARSLFATRNYRSAAIHADAAARIAPGNVDVLVLQANIANQQGKTGSAIEFLKTAISIDTASPQLQFQIGRVYQDANLFDASREHLERAAAIRPNWADPHVALGNLFSKRRLFDDAVAAYETAVGLDPSAETRALLNVAFAERKKSLEFANNTPQLTLSDLNLSTVFSAAYKNYQDQPIGSVKLRNVAATEYGNLKLSFQIKEFMDFPTTVEIPRINGSEVIEIPIKATFNNRILEVDEDTGVQVEVKLTYLRDGQKDDITLTQPMTIYGKNAIVWGNAQMIGSFVTPKDDTLRDYVRQVVNNYLPDAGPLNQKLVSAMAYFSSLTASGTNYIIDPNTPFTELRDDQIDYVQFPRETLRLKSGDCDDLSVLISAGLENLGIHTALIEIPGHLFLMFNTGLSVDEADLISQDHSLLAIKDGNVWIPLEATMVNTNFNEAWAEGARKYQAALAADELGIIDVNEAWKTFQPVTLRKASYSIDLPEAKRTESLVRQSRKLLLAKSVDRLVLPYQTMVVNDPENVAARLQIAILYARYGLYEDAELAFEALNELSPNDSAVMTNQGNMYFLQEEFKSASQSYQRAIELDDEDGGIWINLSMAQFKTGDLKQARNSYQTAVQLDARLSDEYSAYSKLLSN
ncbi:tetratricopeptide repeat protein [Gammaproteobacteria bacterium]|nr:tetratricopeptide repeat protein [Gammaproteobacteria bacterium]